MTTTVQIGRTDVASHLGELARMVLGGDLPVRLRAWDGSETGPAEAPVIVIKDRLALRRLLWHPNELGLAQAYVLGEIDVEGDLADGLRRVWRQVRDRRAAGGAQAVRIGAGQRLRAAAIAARLGVLGPRPAAPAVQANLNGTVHSRERDRAAISHHYDLSNDFYQLVLDPTMAYSCGYWTSTEAGYSLEQAQTDKLDLICRKLGLGPGMRLLDIGCGWGSLTVHAAREYGAQVTAVTLAAQQRAFVADRVVAAGVADLVDVRLQDYRDITDAGYDAVAAIEMGEHVGANNYPRFARSLFELVRPQGRVLVQQMSRSDGRPGGGDFIEAYIAPDMHMRPVGERWRSSKRPV